MFNYVDLVNSIYSSCVIEGLNICREEVTEMIWNRDFDEETEAGLFVRNMCTAWAFILEQHHLPVNPAFVRELNKMCGMDLFHGNGAIRTTNVIVTGTSYVPPIPEYADAWSELDRIEGIEDSIDKACELFCYLTRAQLFIDGNKRVAQLAANKVLTSEGIGMLVIPPEDVNYFRELLVDYYETQSTKLPTYLRERCIIPGKARVSV